MYARDTAVLEILHGACFWEKELLSDALSYYLYADLASMWSTVAAYSLEQDVDIADNLESVL